MLNKLHEAVVSLTSRCGVWHSYRFNGWNCADQKLLE